MPRQAQEQIRIELLAACGFLQQWFEVARMAVLLQQHLLAQAFSGAQSLGPVQLLQGDPAITNPQAEHPFLPKLFRRFRWLAAPLGAPLLPGFNGNPERKQLLQVLGQQSFRRSVRWRQRLRGLLQPFASAPAVVAEGMLAQELLPDLLRLLGFAQLPGAEAKPEAHPRLQGRREGLLQLLLQRQLGATPVALEQERTDLLPGLLLRAQWRLLGQPELFEVRG